jgi:hypothetical protein
MQIKLLPENEALVDQYIKENQRKNPSYASSKTVVVNYLLRKAFEAEVETTGASKKAVKEKVKGINHVVEQM